MAPPWPTTTTTTPNPNGLSLGLSKVSYNLQRQAIFNISLMKLYNHRLLSEPGETCSHQQHAVLHPGRPKTGGLAASSSSPPAPLTPAADPMDERSCDAPPPTFGGVLSVVATATPSLSQQPSGLL
ncbi:SERTA domain-containing protein 2 [Salmo salar]|uniref:SERTA domain-containing protein 2 n=1 Tax=Salmo salar TaxID=8030 RepID=A0ABM3DG37_SALSA|nr:SERTA domain-containing protein 2-like [Salmo salar]